MASKPWSADEMAVLERHAEERDWIDKALSRLPHRTEAAARCMMQKVRIDLGLAATHDGNARWMVDAANASRGLLEALNRTGLRP